MKRIAWNKGIYTVSKIVNCLNCNKPFRSYLKSKRKVYKKYCCLNCFFEKLYRDKTIILKCKICQKEFRTTPGVIKRGKKYCSTKCQVNDFEYHKSKGRSGPLSGVWKGGITYRQKFFRKSYAYKKWRIHILKKFGKKCSLCGESNGRLDIDHIRPIALYPNQALDINNGRVLCFNCHKMTPTYSKRIYWPDGQQ